MEKIKVDEFNVMGISVKTTNVNGKSTEDIGRLWERFFADKIMDKISNRLEDNIYCLYTDYEGNHMEPYSVILGCKVDNNCDVLDGMIVKRVNGGKFTKFTAKGSLTEGVVYQEWAKIWNIDADRVFGTDFEVYGEKAKNPEESEVDIYVAFKE